MAHRAIPMTAFHQIKFVIVIVMTYTVPDIIKFTVLPLTIVYFVGEAHRTLNVLHSITH